MVPKTGFYYTHSTGSDADAADDSSSSRRYSAGTETRGSHDDLRDGSHETYKLVDG